MTNIRTLADVVSRSLKSEEERRKTTGEKPMTAKERSELIGICCFKAARKDDGPGTIEFKTKVLKRAVGRELAKRKKTLKESPSNELCIREPYKHELETSCKRMAEAGNYLVAPPFDDWQPT